MPKQTHRIADFSGGLNRDADPRDIGDNESAILWGWDVSDKGVLRLGGGQTTPSHGPTIVMDGVGALEIEESMSGYGLGFFASDYNLSLTYDRTDYILMADNLSSIHVHPHSSDTGGFNAGNVVTHPMGSEAPGKIQYYSADGGMRIYDSVFENTDNINKEFYNGKPR